MQPLEYEKFIEIGYDDGSEDGVMLLSPACPICRKSTLMRLSQDKMKKFIERAVYVQYLWPEATADQRELLLTGSHPDCWNIMFPPEDEDFEDEDRARVSVFIDDGNEGTLLIFMSDDVDEENEEEADDEDEDEEYEDEYDEDDEVEDATRVATADEVSA